MVGLCGRVELQLSLATGQVSPYSLCMAGWLHSVCNNDLLPHPNSALFICINEISGEKQKTQSDVLEYNRLL